MGLISEKRPDGRFRKRLRRHLYYADMADFNTPSLPLTELSVDYFHDSAPKKLGHVDMETASNIVRKNKVTPCAMMVSVLYARRLRQKNKQYLETISSSDVFFMSMMLASKYLYDEGTDAEVYNDEWAETVDQEVEEVNRMEIDFLQALDWNLFVHPEEFDVVLDVIEKRLALQQGLWRGTFTYAELDVLLGPNLLTNLWTEVGMEASKVIATLSSAYTAGFLSMLGSIMVASHLSATVTSATLALVNIQANLLTVPTLGLIPLTTRQPPLLTCYKLGSEGQCVELNDTIGVNFEQPIGHEASSLKSIEVENDFPPFSPSGHNSRDAKQDSNKFEEGLMKENTSEEYTQQERWSTGRHGGNPILSLWFMDTLLSQLLSLPKSASHQPGCCRTRTSIHSKKLQKGNQSSTMDPVQDVKAHSHLTTLDLLSGIENSRLFVEEDRCLSDEPGPASDDSWKLGSYGLLSSAIEWLASSLSTVDNRMVCKCKTGSYYAWPGRKGEKCHDNPRKVAEVHSASPSKLCPSAITTYLKRPPELSSIVYKTLQAT